MKGFLIGVAIIIGLVVIIAVAFISTRNTIVTKNELVNQSLADIDSQLQRRADLIPNLVNTVKGYATHEKAIFTEIANARAKSITGNVQEKAAGSSELSSALGRLFAVAENYPTLKADQNFIRLQDEIAGTENRNSVARIRYNESVKSFNLTLITFPSNIINSMTVNLKARDYFNPPDQSKIQTPPTVNF